VKAMKELRRASLGKDIRIMLSFGMSLPASRVAVTKPLDTGLLVVHTMVEVNKVA
jgi:hypothetical protein